MEGKAFFRNQKGQVLGLPMYLIIVMIVAVAVIAAVITMIPQGTQMLSSQVVAGATLSTSDEGEVDLANQIVTVDVFSNDERRDPVYDATVTLIGPGCAVTLSPDAQNPGRYSSSAVSATLAENVNEVTLKLVVKAPGYEDFEDDTAVTVYRL